MHTKRIRIKRTAPIWVALLLIAGTLLASAAVTATSGAVVLLASPPPSVQTGDHESNVEVRAFAERAAHVLAQDVTTDVTQPGTYSGISPMTPGVIAAGTVVDSYLLHFDPVGDRLVQNRTGSITFDDEILGVFVLDDQLDASDTELGAPGTIYPAGDNRGIERFDRVTLSADRRTISIQFNADVAVDQVRIVTRSAATGSQGELTGHVYAETEDHPLPGAHVEICHESGACRTTVTDETGIYRITGAMLGAYQIRVFPPPGIALIPAQAQVTVEEEGVRVEKDVVLAAPAALPPNTSITFRRITDEGVPGVNWGDELDLMTSFDAGCEAGYEILIAGRLVRAGALVEEPVGSGTYNATITPLSPLHGAATIRLWFRCAGEEEASMALNIYIDPSGWVRTVNGDPIAGATVTLYRADTPDGPFAQVPDGSAIMSPFNRTNPDVTDADGQFGWDVLAGYYIVRAEAEGCTAPDAPDQIYVESRVMQIPPPVTDLDLRLFCPQPPVADAGGPYVAGEGEALTLDGSNSTDADGAIVQHGWDLDGDGLFDDAIGATPAVTIGDDGAYTVTLRVTDEQGDTATDTAAINVHNRPPSVALNDSAMISFAGGDAFLARQGEEQPIAATATDPGSDDLTVIWTNGSSTLRYNNGLSVDPPLSPSGVRPFTVNDSTHFSFAQPSLAALGVQVVDDDGGEGSAEALVLVTGDQACTQGQGFWKHQLRGQGKRHVDEPTLEAYLQVIAFASDLFAEVDGLTEAQRVMDARGSDMRTKAEAHLLAAWLNFAQGAVGWNQAIAGAAGQPFSSVMAEAEAILADADADHRQLVRAKDLAEAVNQQSGGALACQQARAAASAEPAPEQVLYLPLITQQ